MQNKTNKDYVIDQLHRLKDEADFQKSQYEAIDLILNYIADEDIKKAFEDLGRHYD